MNWTPERIARMRELNAEGWSTSEIAADLGGISRNAVIGKMRRMGIASSNPQRHRAPNREKARPAPTKPQPETPPKPKARPGPPGGVSLMDLTARTCRYPMGDPLEAGFAFCGAEVDPTEPYCETHAAKCYDQTAKIKGKPGNRFQMPGWKP